MKVASGEGRLRPFCCIRPGIYAGFADVYLFFCGAIVRGVAADDRTAERILALKVPGIKCQA